MRALIQRVTSASVTVNNNIVSQIDHGLCVLIGLTHTDTIQHCEYIANKLLTLKLFDNATTQQSWKCNVVDMQYSILCVSQFTLYALTNKNKPDYHLAMSTEPAKALYQQFIELLQSKYQTGRIQNGVFGAMMSVNIVNDGPVTIMIDTDHLLKQSPNNNTT